MDEIRFWDIVDSALAAANGSQDRHVKQLERALTSCTPDEIHSFQQLFKGFSSRGYSWELWGAAYVIHGGCSDDSFTDFRSWLISRGRERYEKTLRDPDSLAELDLEPDEVFFESFAYVARNVYETKTGRRMPLNPSHRPPELSGAEWSEDREELALLYPRLSEKYSRQG